MEMTDTLAKAMEYAEDLYRKLAATMLDIEGMTGKKFYIEAKTGKIKMDKE